MALYTACVTILFEKMSSHNRKLLLWFLALTILLGSFEGVFGRVGYSGDAISYLNMVRAIHAGDWKLAISSYWGLGYPLLLSAITPLFTATPAGEWIAIHVVNMVVLIATFFSFFWLSWIAAHSTALKIAFNEEKTVRLLLTGTLAIFLSIELSLDNVSRVGPDMLVSCVLFVATGLLLQLKEEPDTGRAILLGMLLGVGYIVKSIFLPLTLLFCLVAALAMWSKSGKLRCLVLILFFFCIFAAPYIAGMSWAQGHLTYGDSGPLNYIWNVNKLEPGGLWQGQPPQFGIPLHPTKMVSEMPHVYLFDGPFPVTFGPFFNPPYYYQGVRRFFNLKAQIHAFGGNLWRLTKMLRLQIILYALVICGLLTRRQKQERSELSASKGLWPVILISCCGTLVYLLVILEYRYIASFVAMLFLVILLAIMPKHAAAQQRGASIPSGAGMAWILMIGCTLNLLANEKDMVRDLLGNAVHHRLFYNEDQWKAGLYLQQISLHPGDKVAIMSDLVSATMSTWAYMDKLQIVGILGGSLLENQTMDYDVFWKATPEKQQMILNNFKDVGARIILAKSKPGAVPAVGWQPVPGTDFWIYRF
jgi:hypothetical protein